MLIHIMVSSPKVRQFSPSNTQLRKQSPANVGTRNGQVGKMGHEIGSENNDVVVYLAVTCPKK